MTMTDDNLIITEWIYTHTMTKQIGVGVRSPFLKQKPYYIEGITKLEKKSLFNNHQNKFLRVETLIKTGGKKLQE